MKSASAAAYRAAAEQDGNWDDAWLDALPAGVAVKWQAAVQDLSRDDWGPAHWVIETFDAEADAVAWARERSLAGLNSAYAVPRPWSVRPVAVLVAAEPSPEDAAADAFAWRLAPVAAAG